MTKFEYIDRQAAVQELADSLQDTQAVGLDTEFMRERTYYPQLCLVQVNVGPDIFCVDPLADIDLQPLWQSLHACELVVHSGRQDIEVIYLSAQQMPGKLFDTQVAAALLGEAPQIGYANLVNRLFDIELPKSHTRADWSSRPLRESFLEYAADDVEYLLEAHERLVGELSKADRLEWAREDSMALLNPALYVVEPARAIDRLRGARNFDGISRRVAESLAAWREERAESSDRPRQWIMKDAVLLQLAAQRPKTLSALSETPGMPPATLRKQGKVLLELINDPPRASNHQPPGRPGEADKAMLRLLSSVVAKVAEELGIAAEIIAPRKELADAIEGQRSLRVFCGWRRQVAGERLLEILES
jgi:ribonuclease D